MKKLLLLISIILFITGCRTHEVPDAVRGKSFEQIFIALSKRYEMVYEGTDSVTDETAVWYNFNVRKANGMKEVRQIRRIINREFYPSPNYVWDRENLRIVLIFNDQIIYAGHGIETAVGFAEKKGQ